MTHATLEDLFGPPIHVYTRAQGIEDGALVDVTATAREAGIQFPVAITRAAWERCVTIPKGVECQDETGRLWDVLWVFRHAARQGGQTILFSVHVRNDNRNRIPPRVHLKSICGPGDNGEPVITIMLPEED